MKSIPKYLTSATSRWSSLRAVQSLRGRLGARWMVAALLLPVAAVGVFHFGPRAALVLTLSVLSCMGLGVAVRIAAGKPWNALNPGSIITGLLLGLTLSADSPLSLILLGAVVAEVLGKYRSGWIGSNPFNPAALGRAAVAIVELTGEGTSLPEPDVITAASPLFVGAGGTPAPDVWTMLIGGTTGAIGETSALVLGLTGAALLAVVAIKREAALAMLGAVVVLVLVLPVTDEIYGHAPWVLNPATYLLGGPLFLYAFFFATDPATTPNTRLGGLIFGAGTGAIGVLGRFYTSIPGPEMWALLFMNLSTPMLDRWLRGNKAFSPSPGIAAKAGVRSFYPGALADNPLSPDLVCDGLDALGDSDDESFATLNSLLESSSEVIVSRLQRSGLLGCGGAHFPVAKKWRAVLAQDRSRVLVVNGQEGEPDSFKDRLLMQQRPHLVIEGAAIAAHAIDAIEVHVVHLPDPKVAEALTLALARLQSEHPTLAARFSLVEGPGLYVCGEQSAMLAFLEGQRGEPQPQPPHATESGLRGLPTLVHNVETLAWLPRVLGGEEEPFAELPRLVSISGSVPNPGVYGLPRSLTLQEAVQVAGGSKSMLGFAVGGPTGELWPASEGTTTVGELPGTGTLRIVSADACPVDEARAAARFAAQETCGRCTPCRVGSVELARMWDAIADGEGDASLPGLITELGHAMIDTSACGLGRDAPKRALSVLKNFPVTIVHHVQDEEGRCQTCKKSC